MKFYEVLIETDYINYELYKNDICICGIDLIKAFDLITEDAVSSMKR